MANYINRIQAYFGILEEKTLFTYDEKKLFEKKKASVLLWINLTFLFMFILLVMPMHSSALSSKSFLMVGDFCLIAGMMISIYLIKKGSIVMAGSVTTASLFLGPFIHNVIGDWLSASNISLSRYFESLIVICFIFPLVTSFAIKKRHILFAMAFATVQMIGHFWVLRSVNGLHIEATYLVYIIIAIIPGIAGLLNLNLANEAIGSLITSRNQMAEWNQILEDTVAKRTQELRESNRKLEDLSHLDGLTCISNRRKFDITYALEWNRAKRNNAPLALLIMDLDQFKLYNDSFGHQQGDCCLKQVAKLLADNTQRAGELAARYGGEEFVILLPGSNQEEALRFGERIREKIEDLHIVQGDGAYYAHMTVSIGVAARPLREDDHADAFLNEADQALYLAKRHGRNCVHIF